jgi:hypothetical protein
VVIAPAFSLDDVPSIMIGVKAADMIREDALPPLVTHVLYVHVLGRIE